MVATRTFLFVLRSPVKIFSEISLHYASTSSSLASGSEAISPERAAGCETLLAHVTFLADEWEGATGLEMAAAGSEVLVDHESISKVLWPRAAGWPPMSLVA
jgi:hypothetical protein